MPTLHQHLLRLEQEKQDSICFVLADSYLEEGPYFHETQDALTLKQLIREWSERSCHELYPVAPFPSADRHACHQAFWYARRTNALWLGEYGEARKRLPAYLIERTKP